MLTKLDILKKMYLTSKSFKRIHLGNFQLAVFLFRLFREVKCKTTVFRRVFHQKWRNISHNPNFQLLLCFCSTKLRIRSLLRADRATKISVSGVRRALDSKPLPSQTVAILSFLIQRFLFHTRRRQLPCYSDHVGKCFWVLQILSQ